MKKLTTETTFGNLFIPNIGVAKILKHVILRTASHLLSFQYI